MRTEVTILLMPSAQAGDAGARGPGRVSIVLEQGVTAGGRHGAKIQLVHTPWPNVLHTIDISRKVWAHHRPKQKHAEFQQR